ncbi:hypothetical protein SNEBB_004390 [Seison nebaliae]|nr:hypothetical protein SNEBB_004390 [Seison nebaliae]
MKCLADNDYVSDESLCCDFVRLSGSELKMEELSKNVDVQSPKCSATNLKKAMPRLLDVELSNGKHLFYLRTLLEKGVVDNRYDTNQIGYLSEKGIAKPCNKSDTYLNDLMTLNSVAKMMKKKEGDKTSVDREDVIPETLIGKEKFLKLKQSQNYLNKVKSKIDKEQLDIRRKQVRARLRELNVTLPLCEYKPPHVSLPCTTSESVGKDEETELYCKKFVEPIKKKGSQTPIAPDTNVPIPPSMKSQFKENENVRQSLYDAKKEFQTFKSKEFRQSTGKDNFKYFPPSTYEQEHRRQKKEHKTFTYSTVDDKVCPKSKPPFLEKTKSKQIINSTLKSPCKSSDLNELNITRMNFGFSFEDELNIKNAPSEKPIANIIDLTEAEIIKKRTENLENMLKILLEKNRLEFKTVERLRPKDFSVPRAVNTNLEYMDQGSLIRQINELNNEIQMMKKSAIGKSSSQASIHHSRRHSSSKIYKHKSRVNSSRIQGGRFGMDDEKVRTKSNDSRSLRCRHSVKSKISAHLKGSHSQNKTSSKHRTTIRRSHSSKRRHPSLTKTSSTTLSLTYIPNQLLATSGTLVNPTDELKGGESDNTSSVIYTKSITDVTIRNSEQSHGNKVDKLEYGNSKHQKRKYRPKSRTHSRKSITDTQQMKHQHTNRHLLNESQPNGKNNDRHSSRHLFKSQYYTKTTPSATKHFHDKTGANYMKDQYRKNNHDIATARKSSENFQGKLPTSVNPIKYNINPLYAKMEYAHNVQYNPAVFGALSPPLYQSGNRLCKNLSQCPSTNIRSIDHERNYVKEEQLRSNTSPKTHRTRSHILKTIRRSHSRSVGSISSKHSINSHQKKEKAEEPQIRRISNPSIKKQVSFHGYQKMEKATINSVKSANSCDADCYDGKNLLRRNREKLKKMDNSRNTIRQRRIRQGRAINGNNGTCRSKTDSPKSYTPILKNDDWNVKSSTTTNVVAAECQSITVPPLPANKIIIKRTMKRPPHIRMPTNRPEPQSIFGRISTYLGSDEKRTNNNNSVRTEELENYYKNFQEKSLDFEKGIKKKNENVFSEEHKSITNDICKLDSLSSLMDESESIEQLNPIDNETDGADFLTADSPNFENFYDYKMKEKLFGNEESENTLSERNAEKEVELTPKIDTVFPIDQNFNCSSYKISDYNYHRDHNFSLSSPDKVDDNLKLLNETKEKCDEVDLSKVDLAFNPINNVDSHGTFKDIFFDSLTEQLNLLKNEMEKKDDSDITDKDKLNELYNTNSLLLSTSSSDIEKSNIVSQLENEEKAPSTDTNYNFIPFHTFSEELEKNGNDQDTWMEKQTSKTEGETSPFHIVMLKPKKKANLFDDELPKLEATPDVETNKFKYELNTFWGK